MNGGLSKIRSLHTYVIHRMFYFERYCTSKKIHFEYETLSERVNSVLEKVTEGHV